MCFSPTSTARHPSLNIKFANLPLPQIARTNVDNPVRNFQRLNKLFSVCQHFPLLFNRPILIIWPNYHLLNFPELMHSVKPMRFLPVGPCLSAKAWRKGYSANRQIRLLQGLPGVDSG